MIRARILPSRGGLSFNLSFATKFYFRDETLDPVFPASALTFEWRAETLSAGYFDMGIYDLAGESSDLIFDGFVPRSGPPVLEFFTFNHSGSVELSPALGKGPRTFRIVRRSDRSDLYVDGVLEAMLPAGVTPITEAYLHVGSFSEQPPNYTAIWKHVAYARGAYTPEELPSPSRGDVTSPSAIADLRATAASTRSVTLAWTAPGDDAELGAASVYDLRYTTSGPIVGEAEFAAASQASGEPSPGAAGSAETFTVMGLFPAATYYFALKAVDEAGNAGALSNTPVMATLGAGWTLTIVRGDGQVGTVTKAAAITLTVQVADASGMAVAGASVTFSTSAAPAGAAGHRLSVLSTTTASNGAAASVLTFGDHIGTYTVRAACAGYAPSSVNFTVAAELRLVVSLSPSSIRPLGTETSSEPARTTILVTAAGVSVPDDRVANYPVVLVSTPAAYSGGHHHDDHRPTGRFEVPGNPSVYEANTGIDGSYFLSYVSTWTGGREMITAKSGIDAGVRVATRIVTVEVAGLVLLPTTTFYTKVGGTSLHQGPPAGAIDDNHYGTAEFNAIISSVSAQFKAKFPNRTVRINDMSLPSGGLFDIGPTGSCFSDFPANTKPCKVWSKPHAYHRLGTSCDFNLDIGLPTQGQNDTSESIYIRDALKLRGIKIWPEGDHWHVYLVGGGP
ncbi:MAG: hypothetical protein AAB036_10675 [Elusimicrobiota bacterium]